MSIDIETEMETKRDVVTGTKTVTGTETETELKTETEAVTETMTQTETDFNCKQCLIIKVYLVSIKSFPEYTFHAPLQINDVLISP